MPSQEKMTAMMNVLAKRWLTMGWRIQDPDDAKVMAIAFIEVMDRENIHYRHYEDLYRRSVALRADRMREGVRCDDFSADLMIACWPSLRHEIRQREIDAGRTLPDTAASDCPRCYGVGMEVVPNHGARRCDHVAKEGI